MPIDSKPRRIFVPVERLTFDPRLQMRDLPDGALFDEAWLEHLMEARENGAELPPIEAVHEDGKVERWWVHAGFHRGELARRLNLPSIEVVVRDGTFLDALRLACRTNSDHGRNRTAADCLKAFDALFTNNALRDEVLRSAPDRGGIHRAFAAATGIAKGSIPFHLARHHVKACRREKTLIPIDPPAPPTVPVDAHHASNGHTKAYHSAGVNGSATGHLGNGHAAAPLILNGQPAPPPSPADEGADALDSMRRHLNTVLNDFEKVIASPLADAFCRHADRHGVRVVRLDQLASVPIGEAGPRLATVWNWPALQAIRAVAADTAAAVAAAVVDHQADI